MDENTTKIIKEKFDSLPESIQELIMSSNYQDTLIELGKKYQLNVEQMGVLERETTLVLLGLSPTKDFETELIHELHIDKIKGTQIVTEINEKIFLAIRDLLKLMYTPAGEEPSVEETSTGPKEQSKEKDLNDSKIESREELLRNIENPEPTKSITNYELGITNKNEENLKPITNYELRMDQKELPAGNEEETHPIRNDEGSQGPSASNGTNPILAQKLGGSFKMEPVETDHSIENISKSGHAPYAKNADPYRLPTEE